MIDELLYYPQFCMCAAVATIMLMIMYFMKRNYATRSNRIFFIMLVDNLAASLINITTFYVITYPERYPLWVCNLSNIVYLFLYNAMSVLFLLYVDSMTKVPALKIPVRVIAAVVLLYDGIMLIISPYTHLIIYFDKDLVYSHGPLMSTLYVLAFFVVLIAVAMCIWVRKKFNAYQVFSVAFFMMAVFLGVVFQVFNKRFVISNFVCAMVLFFLYTAFENQAYYLHGDTPCYNRLAFSKTIHKYKKHKKNYIVAAVQIRDYENVVRTLGRTLADKLSERIAERMSKNFGKMAYCIDVNSFAVIFDDDTDGERIAGKINNCFALPYQLEIEDEMKNFSVSPVFNIMEVRDQEIEGHEMVEIIRKLEEKNAGDGAKVDDISKMIDPLRREKELVRIIDKNIKNGGFEVYYQPILGVETGSIVSSEALVRMRDDEGKFVSPEEFIPIAEKSGRIGDIGKFVFEEVCRLLHDVDLSAYGIKYIELNLSPDQCDDDNLAKWMIEVMEKYGVKPETINLEITETSEIENYGMDTLNKIMTELHSTGITFSLDDFGSGFAAIDYLINLPVDIVKIDKGILWQAMNDETSMIILKSTIEMIQTIGKKIVVEGIENADMEEVLTKYKCDYLQGYLYSKPIPKKEYIEYLQNL